MDDPVLDEQGRPGQWQLVDEPWPIRMPPFLPPGMVDGFRIARVFDVPAQDGQPRVDPARGRVTEVAERRRLLGFLEAGTIMAESSKRGTDLLMPRRRAAIRDVCRTDGSWIWDDSVSYYLRWHQVPPEPDLLAHIRARGYRSAAVSTQVSAAALAALRAADEQIMLMVRRWQVETGQLADPARFPFAFQERLFGLGWAPGRDVSDMTEPWLRDNLSRLRDYRLAEHGYRDYELFDAARRVFREFGGLRSRDQGRGVTSARVPFLIFPGADGADRSLTFSAIEVADFGQRLGQPVFQIGTIEHGDVLLVIAADGSVHLTGTVEKFVADSFDAALVALLNGDLPEEDPDDIDPFEVAHQDAQEMAQDDCDGADALWPTFSGLHRTLQHLAGQMPDDWLAKMRGMFRELELAYLPDSVSGGVATLGVGMPAADIDVLRDVQALVNGPEPDSLTDQVTVIAEVPATRYLFTARGLGHHLDELDYAALDLTFEPAVVSIMSTLRSGPLPGSQPVRIYLVEVDAGAPAWTLVVEAPDRPAPQDPPPQTEAYWAGQPLPPYQRAARDNATVLWQRGVTDPDEVSEAADGAQPAAGPAQALVQRVITAARTGDMEALRLLIDWPLTGAPRVARALRDMAAAQRGAAAADWLHGLATAADSDENEGVQQVLRQLTGMLGSATGVRAVSPAEQPAYRMQFAVADVPAAGLRAEQRAQLAQLCGRAAGLSELLVVDCGPLLVPVALAPDTGKLVVVFA